jgi:hypothetical protein
VNTAFLNHVNRTEKGEGRWIRFQSFKPLTFWYRESPRPLQRVVGSNGRLLDQLAGQVSITDPPPKRQRGLIAHPGNQPPLRTGRTCFRKPGSMHRSGLRLRQVRVCPCMRTPRRRGMERLQDCRAFRPALKPARIAVRPSILKLSFPLLVSPSRLPDRRPLHLREVLCDLPWRSF